MSKSKRDLTSSERKLWRRVASTVKTRHALPPEDDHGAPAASTRISPHALEHERKTSPLTRAKVSPPQDRSGEKRVRRGDVEIAATLDLHGHTQERAHAALVRFLQRAQMRGDRAVIVVTGVGRGGEGVLKRMLPMWLAAKEIRALIAGYAPAHRSHGGSGAFYVFIKRVRDA